MPILSLALGALLPCSALNPSLPHAFASGGDRPNVILILMDDIGRDKIDLYGAGASPPPIPNIRHLAENGVIFDNAWVYQSCSPTRAALLTGRDSNRTGIGSVIRPLDGLETPLALSEHLLPEDLPGYRSTFIGKWHLSDTNSPIDSPIRHGFDSFVGWVDYNDFFDWMENVNGNVVQRSGYFPVAMGAHAYCAVRYQQQPSFVYYCPKLAHAPYHRPPASLHSFGGQAQVPVTDHKAMVEAFDTILGRVLDRVDLTNTYVFLIGDNGSPGVTVLPPFDVAKVKGSLYEGGLNVPMIVAGPGIPSGTRCDELVHATDFFATIRELTGFGPPSRGAEESISFAPLLMDPASPGARSHLFVHRFPFEGVAGLNERAVRTKRWKLIEDVDTGECKLFDLANDPFEAEDLLVTQPGTTSDELRQRLLAMMPVFP